MTSYWEFLLYFGVLSSLGLAATGHVVASAILTRWFERRRGTAMSLLGAAGMAGMSILVPVVMGGAMGSGFLSDRVGRKPVLVAVYVLRTAAFALLFFAVDPAVLMVVAAFGGIGMSGSLAMVSALTADIFGRFSVGSIFGTMFLAHQV